jgi:uridine kinase
MGINPEGLKKLFIDFGKLDENSKVNAQGTGLGLSICKKIVEQMGGSVDVQSKIGVGTSFNIILKTKCKVRNIKQKPIENGPKPNTHLQKNYDEFNQGMESFVFIQKNYEDHEMQTTINSLIKRNIKLKFKSSEQEINLFNNLAKN